MRSRVCVLLNEFSELGSVALIERYLPACAFDVSISCTFPADPASYDLIAPFNYRKIIVGVERLTNVLVFHAADLPDGKGWAPIYHAIAQGQEQYVVCGIRAAAEVDAGDIVVRASFTILSSYTAAFLREVDEHLFYLLIAKVLTRWPTGEILAVPQRAGGSYRQRRRPEDNAIDVSRPFQELIGHLRAIEPQHPAYFYLGEEKYLVCITPEVHPVFPIAVLFEYPAIGVSELWEGWA